MHPIPELRKDNSALLYSPVTLKYGKFTNLTNYKKCECFQCEWKCMVAILTLELRM